MLYNYSLCNMISYSVVQYSLGSIACKIDVVDRTGFSWRFDTTAGTIIDRRARALHKAMSHQ